MDSKKLIAIGLDTQADELDRCTRELRLNRLRSSHSIKFKQFQELNDYVNSHSFGPIEGHQYYQNRISAQFKIYKEEYERVLTIVPKLKETHRPNYEEFSFEEFDPVYSRGLHGTVDDMTKYLSELKEDPSRRHRIENMLFGLIDQSLSRFDNIHVTPDGYKHEIKQIFDLKGQIRKQIEDNKHRTSECRPEVQAILDAAKERVADQQ